MGKAWVLDQRAGPCHCAYITKKGQPNSLCSRWTSEPPLVEQLLWCATSHNVWKLVNRSNLLLIFLRHTFYVGRQQCKRSCKAAYLMLRRKAAQAEGWGTEIPR